MAAGDPVQARNLDENIVLNHRVDDDERESDDDIREVHPQRRNIRGNMDGEVWQAAAVANVVGESLQLRSRKWDKYVDMLLRLPFLFLLDQILLQDMGWNGLHNLKANYTSKVVTIDGLPQDNSNNIQFSFTNDPNFTARKDAFLMAKQEAESKNYENHGNITENITRNLPVEATAAEVYQSLYGNPDWVVLPHFALAYCFMLFGVTLFIVLALNTRQLKMFYTYMLCASFIPLSYKINEFTMSQMSSSSVMDVIDGLDAFLPSVANRSIIFNYFAQAAIGYSLSALLRYQMNNNVHWLINDLLPFSILIPSILILVGLDTETLKLAAMMAIFPPAIITITTLWLGLRKAFRSIRHSFKNKYQILQHFGLSTFLETEWIRLQVPTLLRTFWIIRCAQQMLVYLIRVIGASKIASTYTLPTIENIMIAMTGTAKDLLTRGNETTMAVLGMTSIIAAICHKIGSMFHYVLTENENRNVGGPENDEEKSVGSVSAVLFFVLALQTGLTSLNPDKRFARLCKNLCLLVTALFHFVHNMASPVLMSLSAARVINYRRHLRALSICFFLICAPVILMAILWKLFPVGTWLLAVSAFCVEVVVKVLVTFTVYGLFLYDSKVREGSWEYLDDAVYYVRSLGNTVEFCFAVFLFFNGGWILLFESGGTIRALMMLIHAYCNIWCEAKSGWATFVKRRSAVQKINALPDATPDQLSANDDVCAICYQDMDSTGAAKVTKCKHYFHGKCLRKWLYVQDSCPLCYGALYDDKEKQEPNDNEQANRAQVIVPNDGNEGLIDNDHAMERPIDDSEENNSSSSTDDTSSEASVAGSRGDVNVLAVDTETSGSDNDESQENDEASCSCSDEDDDLLYDSMDDCRRNAHSEKTPSPSENLCFNTNQDFQDLRDEANVLVTEFLDKSSSSGSKIDINPSQLSDTLQNSNINLEREDLQIDHMLPTLANRRNDSKDHVSDSDRNS